MLLNKCSLMMAVSLYAFDFNGYTSFLSVFTLSVFIIRFIAFLWKQCVHLLPMNTTSFKLLMCSIG